MALPKLCDVTRGPTHAVTVSHPATPAQAWGPPHVLGVDERAIERPSKGDCNRSRELFLVEWAVKDTRLTLVEPTGEEVRAHAAALADYYNHAANRALLSNTHDFTEGDVVRQFAAMREVRGRPFLLMVGGALIGDCDLRNVQGHTAEYAVMVGPRAWQARGYGTRFSLMVLALAFERLGLDRVYASVLAENAGSLRMLAKVGYVLDASPAARRYAEKPDDVCVSIAAAAFRRAHSEAMARIRIEVRPR
jgi:RimJ/RimL family protein N-acetyltransferase